MMTNPSNCHRFAVPAFFGRGADPSPLTSGFSIVGDLRGIGVTGPGSSLRLPVKCPPLVRRGWNAVLGSPRLAPSYRPPRPPNGQWWTLRGAIRIHRSVNHNIAHRGLIRQFLARTGPLQPRGSLVARTTRSAGCPIIGVTPWFHPGATQQSTRFSDTRVSQTPGSWRGWIG